ncbi:hypothetical protein FOVG_17225 [Fusarium oxysporum f. sp. pisi HDV247]|uniref:Zn(2)-C6 fungal-type domain-containing protein n=1 Tax=Fusarium oxysporum f. sp. pisi HDV247 TaxID=1080344 RepID=W9NEL7_FUSOX|nr:hypothetical protein FOVG_19287 [Fusarium oxysporum f. sp. pisi HDV247]EXA29170.1 hypothetical protein FOVG_19287 [Fusarium oxysporum f. sp. pisi HDV247]EXA29171.1 hypothetical protein FOVG_19287 [Fusarium oxysporum f. sp. pisi HDV247]EXA31523.1 hypothetical protein FOVG_17225 [Fusarium oxysporum f. sp. pisi HDV247]
MGPSSRCTPSRPRHPSRPSGATTARQTATSSISPPANLRRILRERQSARNRKACLPCRERKVKCNHEQPCQTCVKREHPDLCFYQEPGNSKVSNRFQQEPSLHGPRSPETTRESLNNNWVAGNRDAREVDNGSTGAGHTGSPEGQIPTPSLLGGNSIIALARGDSVQPPTENERRTAFETGIFPLLGIDMNAQEGRSPHSHLAQDGNPNPSLPDNQEMIELFSFYRDRVHPFSFVLDDLDDIEKMVCSLINQDMEAWQCDSPSLCLLHAILAAGAQYSNLALAVQLPKYQKYLKHALSFLGTFDYLRNPSKKLIQALLILGPVLQNDMNPRAAWILGGTTIRLALSLGLHQPGSTPGACRISPAEAQHLRLAIVWQDILLSIAFDQPPASQVMDIGTDLPALERPGGSNVALSYRQSMNWMCHLLLRYQSVHLDTASMEHYLDVLQDFNALERSLAPHLKDTHHCCSIQEIQEHHSFDLHRNCAISTLCRPILSRRARQAMGKRESSMILDKFQDALKRSVCALIRLRSMSSHATRSWAFVHNGLSSALLLSFTKHLKDTEDARQIQTQLTQSLTERNEDVGQFSIAHRKALKALQTLQKLAEEGVAKESAINEAQTQRSTSHPDETSIPDEGLSGVQDLSMLDMDDWLRAFDFDSFSPLDAYNFIMSDPAALPEAGL